MNLNEKLKRIEADLCSGCTDAPMDNCPCGCVKKVTINLIGELNSQNESLTAEVDRLTQGIKDIGKECARRYDEIQRLSAELEQKTRELERYQEAERDGQLVVLPCKVGDTVYWVSPLCTGVNQGKVHAIKTSSFGLDLEILRDNHIVKREFERVYLTRAEAEAALSAEGVWSR